MMKHKLLLGTILCIAFIGKSLAQTQKEYNILQYGAIGDGKTLNTETIQKAIDLATGKGGGKVIVPKGRFLTGTLEMKSNVELYLAQDAVLLGSTDPFQYPKVEMKGRPETPKKDDNSQLALLIAFKAVHISITGPGTIDGQGLQLALKIGRASCRERV